MKIEIELSDIDILKNKIKSLENEKKVLEKKIESLDEEKLRQDALQLAMFIFNSTFTSVCDKIGFDYSPNWLNVDLVKLDHYLGKTFWSSERMEVEIGVSLTNKFKTAFIKLGIKLDE